MNLDTNSVYVILAILLVVCLVVFRTTKNLKKSKISFSIFKDLANYQGETEALTPNNIDLIESDINSENSATETLKYIQDHIPIKVDGTLGIAESKRENGVIAARLYTKLEGHIIGTCFFEAPFYGNGDFAYTIKAGSKFYRLTTSNLCDDEVSKKIKSVFSNFECDARLVILSESSEISKIGGIFCKFPDKSHLAFLAMNNYSNNGINKGIVFTGVIAQSLYDYYKSFID